MKLVLVGVVGVLSIASAAAQPDQSTCQDTASFAAEVYQGVGTPQPVTPQTAQAVAQGARLGMTERIRKDTGIGVAADCIAFRSSSSFRAQGNVTLTVGDIVITAEEAVVDKGEIQLSGKARVRLPAK